MLIFWKYSKYNLWLKLFLPLNLFNPATTNVLITYMTWSKLAWGSTNLEFQINQGNEDGTRQAAQILTENSGQEVYPTLLRPRLLSDDH